MQRNNKWWMGAAALALALGAPTLAHAEGDEKMDEAPAEKTEMPAKKDKKDNAAKPKTDKSQTVKPKTDKMADKKGGLNKRTKDMIEAIAGAPLTPAQQETIVQAAMEQLEARKAIEAAYMQKVAAALGMTVEEWDAKDKVYRDKLKAEKTATPKEEKK